VRGLDSPLIQAGTASDCLSGVERYHAFYEWYPGIYATDFPLALRPHDVVSTRIEQIRPDYWTLSIRDDTTGRQSTTATLFRADSESADFVVERPTVCDGSSCRQVSLAKFGQVTFNDAQTCSAPAGAYRPVVDAQPIALAAASNARLLAVPAKVLGVSRSLSVLWHGGD